MGSDFVAEVDARVALDLAGLDSMLVRVTEPLAHGKKAAACMVVAKWAHLGKAAKVFRAIAVIQQNDYEHHHGVQSLLSSRAHDLFIAIGSRYGRDAQMKIEHYFLVHFNPLAY